MNTRQYPARPAAFYISPGLLALFCAAAITACGGGGGGGDTGSNTAGSTNTGTTTTTPTVVDTSSTLTTTVLTPTYTAGSAGHAVFTDLNQARLNCGLGALSQSVKIDQAAQAHQDWLTANRVSSHVEAAGTPGFFGATVGDRLTKAGYAFSSAGEIIGGSREPGAAGARTALRQLLGAPYHLLNAMSGHRQMGVGHSDDTTFYNLVVDFGVAAGEQTQLLGGSDIGTYPCQGSVGVRVHFYGEIPSPVASRDFAASPGGQPVGVLARAGNTLRLTSATVSVAATGTAITPLLLADASKDSELTDNMAFVLPLAPLAANTLYQAQISGTNNGTAFSRSFTFTTGAATDEL